MPQQAPKSKLKVPPTKYTDPATGERTITAVQLKRLSKDKQIEIMRRWFFENYEDPANRTPYESAEGGYIYIWGGPYEAAEELSSEFASVGRDDAIEELSQELNDECWEWTKAESPDDYDQYEIEAALDEKVSPDSVYRKLDKLERLWGRHEEMPAELQEFQLMMTFSFCITVLESHLSDVFLRAVSRSKDNKQRYLSANAELRDAKVALHEVYATHDGLDEKIKAAISNTTFHNIPKTSGLFKKVLGIEFDKQAKGELIGFVNKRHDIIHRAGKNRDGNDVTISNEEVGSLIAKVRTFCRQIDDKLLEEEEMPF